MAGGLELIISEDPQKRGGAGGGGGIVFEISAGGYCFVSTIACTLNSPVLLQITTISSQNIFIELCFENVKKKNVFLVRGTLQSRSRLPENHQRCSGRNLVARWEHNSTKKITNPN